MNNFSRYILVPVLVALLFFLVAAMPVQVLGCRNRGLLVVAIALGSVLSSVAVMARALVRRIRRQPYPELSIVGALILAVPAAFIVMIARM